jgi:hypothetical protein
MESRIKVTHVTAAVQLEIQDATGRMMHGHGCYTEYD